MNKKDAIKNYVISLILGRHIKHSNKIPSEKELAIINNCSRYPVREALKELTYANWIQPQQGRGYFVSGFGYYEAFFAKGAYAVNKTVIRPLNQNEVHYLEYIKIASTKHTKSFAKEYLKAGNLIMKTINNVNNAYLIGLGDDEIKRGFVQSLLKNRTPITHQNREIKFITLNKNDQIAFKWQNEAPVIYCALYKSKEIIEKSIVMIKKEHFAFKKKIVF